MYVFLIPFRDSEKEKKKKITFFQVLSGQERLLKDPKQSSDQVRYRTDNEMEACRYSLILPSVVPC